MDDMELVGVALRAASPARSREGAACLDDQRIAALAEGSVTGPALEAGVDHLAVCHRCRGAVSSVTRALAVGSIAREVDLPGPQTAPRWARYAVPVAAAAAVAALFFVQSESPSGTEAPLHREGQAATAPAPVAISPTGPTTTVRVLRWHAVPGADRYRITLFDELGTVLYETTLADTLAELPTQVGIEAGRSYYWIVAARTGFDRWDTSALVEFSTAGDAR